MDRGDASLVKKLKAGFRSLLSEKQMCSVYLHYTTDYITMGKFLGGWGGWYFSAATNKGDVSDV